MKPELLKVQTLARHAKRVQDFANLRLSLIFKFRSSRLMIERIQHIYLPDIQWTSLETRKSSPW